MQSAAEGKLCIACLEATLYRGLNQLLGFRLANVLAEEIGVAPEVVGGRERDRIDAVFDRDTRSGWELCDSPGECSDKIAELRGGQCSIDPAVSLCELRIVILRAQDDLERTAATHETCEVLDAARAG